MDICEKKPETYQSQNLDEFRKENTEIVDNEKYKLGMKRYEYILKRSNGELKNDFYIYDHILYPYIKHLPLNIQNIWAYSFSEMINNVIDHSHAENVKIEIGQDPIKTIVKIADDGIGIFEGIKKYFGFLMLDECICELFKGKLTTDPKNHSGEGIFFSSKLMDDFMIISSGRTFSSNKSKCGTKSDDFSNHNGTYIIMSLSNFTQKNPQEIFNLYSSPKNGIEKARIPLKNIFGPSAISRSQAKRVCNRLENFKEVILDFEGMEWIGQGFAHQIFTIFAGNYPDVNLKPINMNEDISNMYNHASESI